MRIPDIPSSAFPLSISVRRRPDGSEVRIVARTGAEWTAGELAASADVDALGDAASAVAALDEQVRLLNVKHAALARLAEDTLPGGAFRGVAGFLGRHGGRLAVFIGVAGVGALAASPAGPGVGVAAASFALLALATGDRPVSGRRAEFNMWSTILGGLTLATGFAAAPGLALAVPWAALAGVLGWRCRRLGQRALPALVETVARRLGRPMAADPAVDLMHGPGDEPRWHIRYRDVRAGSGGCDVADDLASVPELVAAAEAQLHGEADRMLAPSDADVLHGTLLKIVEPPATPSFTHRLTGLFRRRRGR